MSPVQLESALKQQAPGPLYLIVGEEDLLRDAALAVIKRAALGSEGDEFNYELFYGDEAGGADIRNSVAAVPVFAARRLVVVKAAEKLTARESEVLLDCVTNPVDSTTLVFVSPKLDGRLKFSHALSRTAVVVDCSPIREAQLPFWIAREAERVGLRLEDAAAHILQESCGASLYGLRRELEKLASYVPPDRAVIADDVHLLRGMDPGASVFDLTLAIETSSANMLVEPQWNSDSKFHEGEVHTSYDRMLEKIWNEAHRILRGMVAINADCVLTGRDPITDN